MINVCVLLSAYNGEKYIEEQIDSLIIQEGINIQILARDDGSNDGTKKILEQYSKENNEFSYYIGNNIGPAKSFFDLMRKAPPADYYAFCDQDDVWDKDKLSIAVSCLEKKDNNKPNMYYSNLRIVDANLNFFRVSHSEPSVQKNKYSVLTEDMATGCTVVFNSKALSFANMGVPANCSMHDSWIYMICKFFGDTCYDFNAHISYRQHGNNVVGTYLERKTKKLYAERIKRLFNRKLQPRYNNAKSFYTIYENKLNPIDKTKVLKLVNYKKSFKNKLILFFDTDIFASSKSRQIRYKLLILMGIV